MVESRIGAAASAMRQRSVSYPAQFNRQQESLGSSNNKRGGSAMTSTTIALGPMSEVEHQSALRRAVIASTVGTTIEWYDFLIYSTVTGLVFSKVYFPGSDPWVGTLQAFGVYFVG